MKRLLRGDVTLLVALLVALAIVAVRLARQKSQNTTETFPHYTVSSSAPSGLLALRRLLGARGYRTEAVKARPRDWSEALAVVVTAPPHVQFETSSSWSGRDARAAVAWVRAGGRLLLLCDESTALTDALEIGFTTGDDDNEGRLAQPMPVFGAVRALSVGGDTRLGEAALDRLIVARVSGQAIASAWRVGKGLVVAVSDPALATNARLGSRDNARFVAGLVDWLADGRPGAIGFDEWHQGDRDERTFVDLIGAPGAAVAWQLVGVAALWAWSASRRFGRPRAVGSLTRTTGDYVRAIADLYRATGAADAVREQMRDSLERDLLAHGASARTPSATAMLDALSNPLVGSTRQREIALLALARDVDRLRKELGLRDG